MPQFAFRSLLSAFILLAFAVPPAPAIAQTFSVLHTFTGFADGAMPHAALIVDPAGNLYGTTLTGGTGSCPSNIWAGCGVIFELKKHNSSYTFNPLYSFQGGTDGEAPARPLVLGPNGTYYGTTVAGGEGTCEYGTTSECGVVFNAGPNATPQRTPLLKFRESVLYRFSGGSDGGNPYSTIIFDHAGNMYGTTFYGGEYGYGAVFELSPAGGGTYTETVLYSFCPLQPPLCPDGAEPADGVIFDSAGNLYGTTVNGGSNGDGAVFELSPSGADWTERVIYSFQGSNDGKNPYGGVAMDSAGNLYGNTYSPPGGSTVYQLIPNGGNWNFNVLYTVFGSHTLGRVTLDSSGNVYETLPSGGGYGFGQVLELAHTGSNWTFIDLYDFTGESDGSLPSGGVVLDSSGNLYGTTEIGGNANSCNGYGCGVVWEITP